MCSNQEKQQQQSGWSTLQIQILQELVGTARRMGDPVAAARHMAFVIQNLDADLTPNEKAELCQQLNVLTAKVRRVAECDGEMGTDNILWGQHFLADNNDHMYHPFCTTLPCLENCRYFISSFLTLSYFSKVPGSSILHTVHDGIILPAVNLYTVPVVERFEPQKLPAALLPVKEARAGGKASGPFLFTPIGTHALR